MTDRSFADHHSLQTASRRANELFDNGSDMPAETTIDWSQDYRAAVYAGYVSRTTHAARGIDSEMHFRTWARATSSRVKGWLPADRALPVLDMGCGAGSLLCLLSELGYTDLTGVDLGVAQLDLARQRCPHATLLQGDLREVLVSNPERFGLIVAFDVIEHFRKDELLPLFTLAAKALRPGGRIIVQTPNADSPWMGPVAYGDLTHEWFFSPASLSDLWRLVGLVGFEARSSTPHPHGVASLGRAVLWGVINGSLSIWSLAETGSRGSGIYSRVFVATAVKG
jgi:2-polyprenyl-3-methyl-5-hydroxy-6-metoxy-1,4-benzoquinol methylase